MGCGENMVRLFKKLSKDRGGTTAIEFAFLALPFFGLIFGIIQIGIVFLVNQTLDGAVETAARLIQTGQVQASNISESAFKTTVCNNLSLVANCQENLLISVESFPNFASIDTSLLYDENDFPIISGTYNPGQGGDIVIVSAAVSVSIVVGSIFRDVLSGNGTRLTASTAFTNEQF